MPGAEPRRSPRQSPWAIVLAVGLAALPVRADEPATIRVLAQVPSKPYYVGQAIELRIGAEAEGERPEVSTPSVNDADVAPIGNALSPLGASGIGDVVAERNLFVTRFRIIPRRAGVLRIPSVRVRLGARSGASPPLQVVVRPLPIEGRPADFLGGVGGFSVEAEAQPSTVRAGQELTFTIHVTGPAARGMTLAPNLERFAQVPLGLGVKPLPTEAVGGPPARWFRYRVRPTRAGEASLPPVPIAAFDPQAGRYVTKVTSSIPIRVVAVPAFDASRLDYQPPPMTINTPRRSFVTVGRTAASLVASALGISLVLLVARTISRRWAADPRRQLMRGARALDERLGAEPTARLINDLLADYLKRTRGRPRGVLTHEEARAGVAGATRRADLGDRAARLVADCDRARYSNQAPGAAELVTGARRLFDEIGRLKTREWMRKDQDAEGGGGQTWSRSRDRREADVAANDD